MTLVFAVIGSRHYMVKACISVLTLISFGEFLIRTTTVNKEYRNDDSKLDVSTEIPAANFND